MHKISPAVGSKLPDHQTIPSAYGPAVLYRLSPALLKPVYAYSLVTCRLRSIVGTSERGQKRKN